MTEATDNSAASSPVKQLVAKPAMGFFKMGGTVQVNPATQKLVGALN